MGWFGWRNACVLLLMAGVLGLTNSLPAQEEPPAKAEPQTLAELRRDLRQWQKALAKYMGEIADRGGKGTATGASTAARNEAVARLGELRDPRGVPLIREIWEKEQADYVRQHFIRALQNIGDHKALLLMAEIAVEDRSPEIRREAAIWISLHSDRNDTIPLFVKYLQTDKFQTAALTALGYTKITKEPTGPPDPDLVAALVDNLYTVTPVRKQVPWQWGGVVRRAPRKPRAIESYGIRTEWVWVTEYIKSENPTAKDMLYQYTYQDFGYDQAIWRKNLPKREKPAAMNQKVERQ